MTTKYFSLVDPDELVLASRAREAQPLIEEAVLSYRAGAFGSAIAKTWQAVCIDGVEKLRRLSLHGEKDAKSFIDDFDRVVELRRTDETTADQEMMRLEKKILDVMCGALKLISGYERMDLERLRQDRNRCEHLSYHDRDKLFQPSPELARLHLRTAVETVLSRPAFRGHVAASRLLERLQGSDFPAHPIAARMQLSRQELMEMDDEALQIVVDCLFHDLFQDQLESSVYVQRLSALSAVEYYGGLQLLPILEKSIAKHTESFRLVSVSRLLLCVKLLPWMWLKLPLQTQENIENFLGSVSLTEEHDLMCWATAMQIDHLVPVAVHRLNEIDAKTLLQYREFIGESLLIDVFLHHLDLSQDFATSKSMFRLLRGTLLNEWSSPQLEELRSIIRSNGQVSRATGLSSLLFWLFQTVQLETRNEVDDWVQTLSSLPYDADDMEEVIGLLNARETEAA